MHPILTRLTRDMAEVFGPGPTKPPAPPAETDEPAEEWPDDMPGNAGW